MASGVRPIPARAAPRLLRASNYPAEVQTLLPMLDRFIGFALLRQSKP